ncbi:MAG TPA: TolC family protein [Gemmatimonadales bacterium]|jgi:cobalt-zinc-cadmium efflux system outer membrane protein|nr:TolC family protein [Gemmatimonadales bacterium]
MRPSLRCRLCLLGLAVPVTAATAQAPLTRAAAVAAALAHSPRLAVAVADSSAAAARRVTAGALTNPNVVASYTKDVPQYHVAAEVPVDFLWLRGLRVDAAQAGIVAAANRSALARATVALDADTTYTRALAAAAHARLSASNAVAADSVRRIAVARRDAGDASDLDVELATIAAGQQANLAAADSLAALSALIDLAAVMGVPASDPQPVLADSLAFDRSGAALPPATAFPLAVAAAAADRNAAALGVTLQHRNVFGAPSITFGFDTHDPTGAEPGLLPTIGVALPLPIFNRNRGPIAEAVAERASADAELAVARADNNTAVAHATRDVSAAVARVTRDQQLLGSADRVAALSLTAYREGAVPIANVLEAARTARDVVGQYIDDVAAALTASAVLRTLAIPATGTTP